MNAERLLQLYDRVSDAPDAIPRLRRFILDLAVRGKLVKQDSQEESSLENLSNARRRLEEAAPTTKRLRWKPSTHVLPEQTAKNLPPGWVFARVNDTGFYINGLAFKPADWKQAGLPIIRIQNLTDPAKEFNFAEGEFPDEVIVRDGDLLVSWSATLEAFKWDRGIGVLNQHIFRVIPDEGLTARPFLLLLLRNAIREMAESEHAHGLAMMHINRGPFLEHIVLVPPIAEQHRIVAKVDELMALCDSLEGERDKREATRDRLTTASLSRLTAPDVDEEQFRAQADFAINVLPELTTRPDQIKVLRQTLLDLAVRGRFGKGIRGKWEKVGTYRKLQNGYAFKSSWFSKQGVRLLRNANVGHGKARWEETVHLPAERAAEFERFMLNEGDIVLSLDRPFIVTGTKVARMSPADLPALLLQRVGRFLELRPGLSDEYLFAWLSSPQFSDQIDPGRSNGVPHVSSRQVEEAAIFVPSIEDQSRVVDSVLESIGLSDDLAKVVTEVDYVRTILLNSLLSADNAFERTKRV